MQISKIERSLKKISNLVELFKMDGKLSNIEKDLLKDYIRRLYDQIGEEHGTEELAVIKQVSKPIIETEHIIPIKQESVTRESVVTETPMLAHPIPESIKEQQPLEAMKVDKVEDTQKDYAEFTELFTFDEVTDLSGRLSMTKIDDINKAVGINERMFTIKELFDGDNSAYDQTIKTLNSKQDFNTAKAYLSSDIINRFNWNTDEKLKKAQNFIKIIRRLYA